MIRHLPEILTGPRPERNSRLAERRLVRRARRRSAGAAIFPRALAGPRC